MNFSMRLSLISWISFDSASHIKLSIDLEKDGKSKFVFVFERQKQQQQQQQHQQHWQQQQQTKIINYTPNPSYTQNTTSLALCNNCPILCFANIHERFSLSPCTPKK